MTAGSGDLTSDHGVPRGPVSRDDPRLARARSSSVYVLGSHGDELVVVTWADIADYAANAA